MSMMYGRRMSEPEHQPGEPAPRPGHYEALNLFGRPTGTVVECREGEPLPDLPQGFTWRRVTRAWGG
jgi:hypothetical protein